MSYRRHNVVEVALRDDAKFSLRNKRNTAGWDDRYLAKLLFEATKPPT